MAAPACPRCGYDLSGAVGAWEGACPLAGVCSECGLELEWRRVLNSGLTTPRWSFEHTMDRRIRRLVATWAVATLPWVFWRQLRLRRLLIFAAVLLLLTHSAFAIAQGWETHAAAASYATVKWGRAGLVPDEEPWVSAVLAGLWPYRSYTIGWAGHRVAPYRGVWLVAPMCLLVAAPLAMLLLPDTFKLARVRRVHIVRGAIYGSSMPVAAALVVVAMVAMANVVQIGAFRGPPVWMSLAAVGGCSGGGGVVCLMVVVLRSSLSAASARLARRRCDPRHRSAACCCRCHQDRRHGGAAIPLTAYSNLWNLPMTSVS